MCITLHHAERLVPHQVHYVVEYHVALHQTLCIGMTTTVLTTTKIITMRRTITIPITIRFYMVLGFRGSYPPGDLIQVAEDFFFFTADRTGGRRILFYNFSTFLLFCFIFSCIPLIHALVVHVHDHSMILCYESCLLQLTVTRGEKFSMIISVEDNRA